MLKRLQLFVEGNEIPIEYVRFPGGEVKIKIMTSPLPEGQIHIFAALLSSDDVVALIMLVDAARRISSAPIRLTMPYIPYARQDRVCNSGESFSLKVFAEIINSLQFSSVIVYDPHSKTSTNLIERCVVVPNHELIRKHEDLYNWMTRTFWSGVPLYFVCPDKGAIARTKEIADHFSVHGIIYAEKVRNPENGQIVATQVLNIPDDIDRAKLLVIDDICDGGRTFIELGKVLRTYEPKEMNLYVTHGIFSQGMGVLTGIQDGTSNRHYNVDMESCKVAKRTDGFFDNVWCTFNFNDYQ